MEFGKIKWKMEISQIINVIRATGVDMNNINGQELLIFNTFQILELVTENKGALIPLTNFPSIQERQERKNSIYFEIIFESRENLENFLKAVEGRSN